MIRAVLILGILIIHDAAWAWPMLRVPLHGSPSPGTDASMLTERVRNARIAASQVTEPLVIGGWYGGHFLTSSTTADPLMPNTLDVYFASWVLSSRAHLLLKYAEAASSETPRRYAGLPALEQALQEARDVEDRRHVANVVREGRYENDWAPFVRAYRAFVADASRRESGTPSWDGYLRVGAAAREHGLFDLIATTRIEPQHVAQEMLGRLAEARVQYGAADRISREDLLYWCDSGVHVRPWHPLALTLLGALDQGDRDPRAQAIRTAYGRLTHELTAWVARNPSTDSTATDIQLRRLGADLKLFDLIEGYEAGVGIRDDSVSEKRMD